MTYKFFYSWQSDTPGSTNRGFIEDALTKASASVAKDDTVDVEPVIDRDTLGVGGSPEIVATIFEKIDNAQAFVADVTIINQGEGKRPTPNPNVLLELGYAASRLGWPRILMVMNTEHGKVEDLPFDLRMRRIMTYAVKQGEEKAEVRKRLIQTLGEAMRHLIEEHVLTTEPEPEPASPSQLAISAIEEGKGNQKALVRRYWQELVEKLVILAPDWQRKDVAPDLLMQESIDKAVPLFVEFARLAETASSVGSNGAAEELGRGFEGLLFHYDLPPGYSGPSTSWDFDFFKFVGHELYVDLVAVLLSHQRWGMIANLFGLEYFLQTQADRGRGKGLVGMEFIYKEVKSIETRNLRLRQNQSSVRADVLRELHSAGSLAEIVPFDQFIDAEHLCFLKSEVSAMDDHGYGMWSPWTSVYLNHPPRFLLEARKVSRSQELAGALGFDSPEGLKRHLIDRQPFINDIWRSSYNGNPITPEVLSSLGTKR